MLFYLSSFAFVHLIFLFAVFGSWSEDREVAGVLLVILSFLLLLFFFPLHCPVGGVREVSFQTLGSKFPGVPALRWVVLFFYIYTVREGVLS